jgi:hypothetical protein
MEAPPLWLKKSFSRQHWSDPNDRTICVQIPLSVRYLDRNARRNVNPLPPILSAIVTDYNNRRVLSGFGLHLRLRAAHLTGKEDHR